MPHFGASSAEVVMRIVYDGEPEAGKTTNVHGLTGQVGLLRRGKVASHIGKTTRPGQSVLYTRRGLGRPCSCTL